MPIYNVTFGFRGNGQGWSETHACRASSTNPQDLALSAISIAQKRVTFLGREFSIVAIRISKYSNDDGTAREKGVFPIKQIFTNPVQTVTMAAEPSNVAVIGIGFSNPTLSAQFPANTNRTFCGAPPDPSVSDGGIVDPAKSNLGTNFNQWAAALATNSYGWLASKSLVDLEISSIDQLPNGKVELTTIGNVAPAALNGLYPARIRKVNNGSSPLNGPVIIRVTGAATVVTTEVIGLALAQQGGAIRIYSRISPFVPFAGLTLDLESAKHKRGRPFGSEPGRAKKRVRG